MFCRFRLDDDERLDALLDQLEKKAPNVAVHGSDTGSTRSMKGELSSELMTIRKKMGDLEMRLGSKRAGMSDKKPKKPRTPGRAM